MNLLILDASVGAKWIFDEPLSDKALGLLKRFELHEVRIVVPEFFYTELGNVCWMKARRKLASMEQVIKRLDYIMELSLEQYSDRELSDVALENALRFGISAYDGIYVALAEIYVAPLITADEGLYNACRDRFDFIELLKDVSPH